MSLQHEDEGDEDWENGNILGRLLASAIAIILALICIIL